MGIEWLIESTLKAPQKVVDDLNRTEDGEAGEKAHSATYQSQLGFHCHLKNIAI